MYSSILPVFPRAKDLRGETWLSVLRPDFVYGIDVDHRKWAAIAADICQPRGYAELTQDFVDNVYQRHPAGLISCMAPLRKLQQDVTSGRVSPGEITVVGADPKGRLYGFAAVSFGVLDPRIRTSRFIAHNPVFIRRSDSYSRLVNLALTANPPAGWLQLASYGLRTYSEGMPLSTVVVINNNVSDLSLYWNLRGSTLPSVLLPFPLRELGNPDSVDSLASALHESSEPNGVTRFLVASMTASRAQLGMVRRRLRSRLSSLADYDIELIDHHADIPRVIPYDTETTQQADCLDNALTWQCPQPQMADVLTSPEDAWFVDLVRDGISHRAVREMSLPGRKPIFDVLNTPSADRLTLTAIPRVGYALGCINVRCTKRESVINLPLPASAELIEELLSERGYEVVYDEKRTRYERAIELFGGLQATGRAVTGNYRRIVETLVERQAPITIDSLKGELRLGRGALSSRNPTLDAMLDHLQPTRKRVLDRRMRERESIEAERSVEGVLESWAQKGVVRRRILLGVCSGCGCDSWTSTLEPTGSVTCTECGHNVKVTRQFKVGYELNPLIRTACREGMVPVVLTLRFLRCLTGQGFLWVPGIKCQRSGDHFDIDVVAFCDEQIVFAECKDLRDAQPQDPVWSSVSEQVEALAGLADVCRADLVVLATMAESIPRRVTRRMRRRVGGERSILALESSDLEMGVRQIDVAGNRTVMLLRDVVHNGP